MPATWFKCDPLGFLSAFERIGDVDQAMVYVVICLRIYLDDGPVPNRPDAYTAQCNMGPKRIAKAIAALLKQGRLQLVDGDLMNPRAADEIGSRRELAAAKSHPGKAGRPRKLKSDDLPAESTDSPQTGAGSASDGRSTAVGPPSDDDSRDVSGAQPFENTPPGKSNDLHARAREDQIREESPQTPTVPAAVKPGSDEPPSKDGSGVEVSAEEKARRLLAISNLAKRDPLPEGVDTVEVTGKVMQIAKMVSGCSDSVLVSSWLRLGCDPEVDIYPIVRRLSANARGGVRGMRYFDEEIRRAFGAKDAQSRNNIADFERIKRRHSASEAMH